jgi:hypothetical protein
LVDERGGSNECADDPGLAAFARLARLGPFPEVVGRVEECTVEPYVVNRVAAEVAGRHSSAELSDPVGDRPKPSPAPVKLVDVDRQTPPIKPRLLRVKFGAVDRRLSSELAVGRQPSAGLAADRQPFVELVDRVTSAYGRPSSTELGVTTSHRARDQGFSWPV